MANVNISFPFAASHSIPAQEELLARSDLGSSGRDLQELFGQLSIPPGAGQEPGATVSSFHLHKWGCKRFHVQQLRNGLLAAKGSASALPLLHNPPALLVLRDAAFHRGGLPLALQLLHPLPGRTLHLNSAPSPRLPFPTPAVCPQIHIVFLLCVWRGALQGLLMAPKCHLLKAKAKTQLQDWNKPCPGSSPGFSLSSP